MTISLNTNLKAYSVAVPCPPCTQLVVAHAWTACSCSHEWSVPEGRGPPDPSGSSSAPAPQGLLPFGKAGGEKAT